MRVAVTSASGQLGGAIVKALVDEIGESKVVAIARNPEKAENLGVEVRKGDYDHKPDFMKGLQDIDRVILLSSNGDPEKRKRQHTNVIDAALDCGVRKLVYTSILGPHSETDFSPVVSSNRQTEEYLKASGLHWVIGRNGIYIEPDIEYVDNYIKAGKIANCAGDGKCGYTTRSELAIAYSKMIVQSEHDGSTYNLTGNAITQAELADYINIAFGTSIHYELIPVEDYQKERISELGEFLGTIISGIYQGIRNGAFEVPSDYKKATGRDHLTWSEFFAGLRK